MSVRPGRESLCVIESCDVEIGDAHCREFSRATSEGTLPASAFIFYTKSLYTAAATVSKCVTGRLRE
jgi:hypothetical protein